jgi:hypothetical protein
VQATRKLIAAYLALASLSLLLLSEPSYDPWAWLVWGRELAQLELDTSGGPSWKPLPVALLALASPLGGLAVSLWMVVARGGALLAPALAARPALALVALLAASHLVRLVPEPPDPGGDERRRPRAGRARRRRSRGGSRPGLRHRQPGAPHSPRLGSSRDPSRTSSGATATASCSAPAGSAWRARCWSGGRRGSAAASPARGRWRSFSARDCRTACLRHVCRDFTFSSREAGMPRTG